jgi:N-methylhydantoinase A
LRAEPAAAVVAALDRSEVEDGVARLVHGTTVATNAVLQREGARLCLLTTAGFEDVPYIQRLNRPFAYSLKWSKPKPLVRRRRILGVRERVDASGQVVKPLAKEECDRIVSAVRKLVEDEGVEAIAISLLFSYLNDAHEQELEERLSKALPHIPISRSTRISPIWREYERANGSPDA